MNTVDLIRAALSQFYIHWAKLLTQTENSDILDIYFCLIIIIIGQPSYPSIQFVKIEN